MSTEMGFLSETGQNSASGGLKNNVSNQFTLRIDDPIICKLVRHPNFKTETGENKFQVVIRYWPFKIGNEPGDIRYRPCNESLGKGQSKEYEYYKGLYKKLDTLKEDGKKDSEEYKILEDKIKKIKPKYFYYYLYITPESPVVKALKAPISVHNQIAGRVATQFREEIPSVFDNALKKGMNISLTGDTEKNKKGWIKIWRTGEKMGTRYHVAIDSRKEVKDFDGTTAEVTVHNTHPSPDINAISKGEWPDIYTHEERFAWTQEECQEWIDSDFTKTPERVLQDIEKARKDKEEKSNTDNNTALTAEQLEEIPF